MTVLLVGWVLVAPVLLLMRRALWMQAHTRPRSDVARDFPTRLMISLAVINEALRQGTYAAEDDERVAAGRILRGAYAGTALLARDMRRELGAWGAATWGLNAAAEPPVLAWQTAPSAAWRAVACLERGLTLILPGNLARLRTRMFALNLAWRAMEWHTHSLCIERATHARHEPAQVQARLHELCRATQDVHVALLSATRATLPYLRLAT